MMECETWIIHLKFHFVWVCASEKKSCQEGQVKAKLKGRKIIQRGGAGRTTSLVVSD